MVSTADSLPASHKRGDTASVTLNYFNRIVAGSARHSHFAEIGNLKSPVVFAILDR